MLQFLLLGLIGRFKGLCPSLHGLNTWISENWEPFLNGCVHIYLINKGVFIVVFEKTQDINKVLCGHLWSWEDKFPLMLKLSHLTFNPTIKVFDKIPLWARFLNPSLHFWFDSCYDAVGNTFGSFLMVCEVFLISMTLAFLVFWWKWMYLRAFLHKS